jgi:hypothetical protein
MLEIFQASTNKREGGCEVTFMLVMGGSNNERYYGID